MIAHTIILDSSNSTKLDTIVKKIFKRNIDINHDNPDILKLGIKKEINSIKISEIKHLKQWIKLKPFQERNKAVIIYNAELLTIEAQNSLLKVLEEPPKNSYIILITNNHRSLLDTILSRAQLETTTSKIKNTDSDKGETIFLSPLDVQFKWIEKLFKSKTPHQRKEIVTNLIVQIQDWLIKNENDNIKKNLQLLEKSLDALNKNISIKLILENLFLNLIINKKTYEKI